MSIPSFTKTSSKMITLLGSNVKISQRTLHFNILNCTSNYTTSVLHKKILEHSYYFSTSDNHATRIIPRTRSCTISSHSKMTPPFFLGTDSPSTNLFSDCTQFRSFSSLMSNKNNFVSNNSLLHACKAFAFSRQRISHKSRNRYEGMTEDEILEAVTKQRIMEAGLLDEPLHKVPDSFNDSAGWIMRLANENGYASFCRNAYLAMMVAITVNIQNDMLPCYKEVSFLFLLIGASQLVYGTATYIYTILKLRRRAFMSRSLALTVCCYALFHLFLWSGAVLIYMGYADDASATDEDDPTSPEVILVETDPVKKV